MSFDLSNRLIQNYVAAWCCAVYLESELSRIGGSCAAYASNGGEKYLRRLGEILDDVAQSDKSRISAIYKEIHSRTP